MQLNAEDNGHRKHTLVQIPEKIEYKSKTARDGYRNICEIGKERIRRAAGSIREYVRESHKSYARDIEFRVKCEDSMASDTPYSAENGYIEGSDNDVE